VSRHDRAERGDPQERQDAAAVVDGTSELQHPAIDEQ